MSWRYFPDKEMVWTVGCDLKRWMIGIVWFWGGFCISVGPFYIERCDVPF